MTRERLKDTRASITHKAVIRAVENGNAKRLKFYLTVGLYDDGRPGELFLHMDESGSTLDGMANIIGICVSLCLQEGVPLERLVEKLAWQEFEPKGLTENPKINFAKSVVDYVVRWMDMQFQGT
jgi:ribonucleoside-diphosphate reductase alpha chain